MARLSFEIPNALLARIINGICDRHGWTERSGQII